MSMPFYLNISKVESLTPQQVGNMERVSATEGHNIEISISMVTRQKKNCELGELSLSTTIMHQF
jgi:hypothetical protein